MKNLFCYLPWPCEQGEDSEEGWAPPGWAAAWLVQVTSKTRLLHISSFTPSLTPSSFWAPFHISRSVCPLSWDSTTSLGASPVLSHNCTGRLRGPVLCNTVLWALDHLCVFANSFSPTQKVLPWPSAGEFHPYWSGLGYRLHKDLMPPRRKKGGR